MLTYNTHLAGVGIFKVFFYCLYLQIWSRGYFSIGYILYTSTLNQNEHIASWRFHHKYDTGHDPFISAATWPVHSLPSGGSRSKPKMYVNTVAKSSVFPHISFQNR